MISVPSASGRAKHASGTNSSGTTHSDWAVRSDANMPKYASRIRRADDAWTRKVSARVWRTFRRARLAVTQRRCVFLGRRFGSLRPRNGDASRGARRHLPLRMATPRVQRPSPASDIYIQGCAHIVSSHTKP
jgi:hypothetical protein